MNSEFTAELIKEVPCSQDIDLSSILPERTNQEIKYEHHRA